VAINQKIVTTFNYLINGLAIACLLAYGISSLLPRILPANILLPFVFLLGCAGIIALANIHFKFSFEAKETRFYKIGIIFLVLAFFQLTVMLTVQQAIIVSFTETLAADTKLAFNSIQLGMDMAFDIFYSIGIFFISISFLTENIHSLLAWYGIIISITLLILNFVSFPVPPKDKGLYDLGIFTIIWWVMLIRKIKTKEKQSWQKHLEN
jgi:hypothetical protein